jgi:hypothetical protein
MQRSIILLAATALLAGCGGGLKVQANADPEASFNGWQTYRWAERTEEGKQDRRVYNYVVEGRVKEAVNLALQEKGFREDSTASDVDFLVGWHGFLEGQVNFSAVSSVYEYGWGWFHPGSGYVSSQTYMNYWRDGTLMIDIVDAREEQLVWRGMGTGSINPDDSLERKQENMNDAARRILKTFPTGGE